MLARVLDGSGLPVSLQRRSICRKVIPERSRTWRRSATYFAAVAAVPGSISEMEPVILASQFVPVTEYIHVRQSRLSKVHLVAAAPARRATSIVPAVVQGWFTPVSAGNMWSIPSEAIRQLNGRDHPPTAGDKTKAA
jgi:hypothetical protein